jgi:endonuclease/exonuclease/phosphatase family metal-dependent hydrolase
MLAAQINKNLIDSLLAINPDTKIMLMGDLNDEPTSKPVLNVLNAKADKADVGAKDIYNPWIKMYKKGLGTENYQGNWGLIDQIMVTGAFLKKDSNKWAFYNAEIFNKDFLLNKIGKDKGLPHRSFTIAQVWDNGYSDHLPVLVYLIKAKNN